MDDIGKFSMNVREQMNFYLKASLIDIVMRIGSLNAKTMEGSNFSAGFRQIANRKVYGCAVKLIGR